MARRYYLGNSKLKAAGVKLHFTPEQYTELAKCSADPIYFIKKYVKIVNVDDGFVPLRLWDFQERLIQNLCDHRFFIGKLPRQCGKMLRNEEIIYTPDGSTTMGELKVGDQVINELGQPTNVVYVSDEQLVNMYRLTFDDGSTIECCEDHQWTVYDRLNQQKKTLDGTSTYHHRKITKTAKELHHSNWKRLNSRGYQEYAYYIPNTQPVEHTHKSVSIDPYILGIWLGDGTNANTDITCDIKHLPFYESQGLKFGINKCRNHKPNLFTGRVLNFQVHTLREYNILQTEVGIKTKRIPPEYLYNDVQTRISVLQGLMDTDGHISKDGHCYIQLTTKNQPLLDDVFQLLCSLGLKVTVKDFPATESQRLSFSVGRDKFDVCRMPYKLARQKQRLDQSRHVSSRTIQNIEKLNQKAAGKCIQVDSPSSLYLCGKQYIPTHNTTCVAAYFLHYVLFNKDKKCAILANKGSLARDILGRIQKSYESLPEWLQQGVVEWNKGSIELENGSKIIAAATASSAIRGETFNVILLDEFAHIHNNLAEEFFASVYPTISSGNDYFPFEVHWSEIPGRDEAWKQQTIKNTSADQFAQEFGCEFLGSQSTLINSAKLKTLAAKDPIIVKGELKIYQAPYRVMDQYYKVIGGGKYAITVDVSRGLGNDYSTFSVWRIDREPFEQVATYRNDLISPYSYPNIISHVAEQYNNAHVLIEINDAGLEVADNLIYELEYENVFMVTRDKKRGQVLTLGGASTQWGVRTDKRSKRIGCQSFKDLLEGDQMIINDQETIEELFNFVAAGASYQADVGFHDDMVMTCVLFGWLTHQQAFKQYIESNPHQKDKHQLAEETLPFGFVNNGVEDSTKQLGILPGWEDASHLLPRH